MSSSRLPIDLDDLLHARTVESSRIEFKAEWNEHTREATLRTVAAFANDLQNLNGGYIVVGVEEENGRAKLPARGVPDELVDTVQKEIAGGCKGSISPEYLPLIFVERIADKTIVVVWAPGGENRPYEAPKRGNTRGYFVRAGSATLEATGDLHRQLMEQAAKIPFDDRRALEGTIDNISMAVVRPFLKDAGSYLADAEIDREQLLLNMRLIVRVNGHYAPRNVALLCFADEPTRYFRSAFIEVVRFGNRAGDILEERKFDGPLQQQLRSCISYLIGLTGYTLEKVEHQPETERIDAYPRAAVEEALANAVYHRGYDQPEPTKVYLYPDRMAITSYPGPMAGIAVERLQAGNPPIVPARNRRIGEFLKELRLAEKRGTGVPKILAAMKANGSPPPVFEFDDERTYFTVTLPMHEKFPKS